MRDVFAFIAPLMRRQFRFYAAIVAIGVVGIVYANGWSWTSAVVILLTVAVLPLAWALVWFWATVFSNVGRQGDMR